MSPLTKRTQTSTLLAALSLLLTAFPPGSPTAAAQESLLATEVAVYDALRGRNGATAFRLAWLAGTPVAWRLAPMAGAMTTTDGTAYGYGGLYMDLQLGEKLFLLPSFAAGLYSPGGGPDLGHTIEFRSGAIAGWRFPGGTRIGIAFHHVSNADLGRRNPGTETLGLSMTIPLRE